MKILDVTRANKIYERVAADSESNRYFFGMVILSCTVATYGLLSNSTAVVIGAMLLAPLMGPILGGALGIATQSNNLLKESLRAEFAGAGIAVLFSAFLTVVLPDAPLTSEVLSRTTPTILDLVIALASGIAGTYAVCAKKAGAALPGVAIATALMPPLCVIGIGLAKHDYSVASGAGLLFAANLIAINVAALATFEFLGLGKVLFNDKATELNAHRTIGWMLFPVVMLILISVPLALIMYKTYHSAYIDKIMKTSIEESLNVIAPGSTLITIDYNQKNGKYFVDAAFRTTKTLEPEEVRKIENFLELKLGTAVEMNADVVLTQKVNHSESYDTYGRVILLHNKPAEEKIKMVDQQEIVENVIREKMLLLKNVQLEDFAIQYQRQAGEYQIKIIVSGDKKEITPAFTNSVKTILEDRFKRRVTVVIEYKK